MPFIGETSIRTGASGAGFSGNVIADSVIFNDDDADYLEWTPAGAGTATAWTVSFWVKRGVIGTLQKIFTAQHTTTYQNEFSFESDDTFRISLEDPTGTNVLLWVTQQVFRDPTAWYHIVFAWSADASKLYVNGVEVTALTKTTTPSAGASTNGFNAAVTHYIGRYAFSAAQYLDAYLTQFAFIDGTVYTADDFGETDVNGNWAAKSLSGLTFGTNGFYITGADSADLGADYSGNGNDFTSSGLTSDDQVIDTPTDNFCTWNPLIPIGINTFTLGNTEVTQPWNGGSHKAFGNIALRGNVYWETEASVIARSRWYTGIGAADASQALVVYSFNGNLYYNGADQGIVASTFVAGDRIGWAYSEDADALWMRINGTWQNGATIGEIEAGTTTNAVYTGMSSWDKDIFFLSEHGDGLNNTMTSRLYVPEDTWENAAPTGFKSLATQNLPAPTIADPSAHFNTVLYTGNGTAIGSGGNAITGVGFQPDFVWIKNRDAVDNHMLYDAVRGATKDLHSNTTDAEATDTEGLSTFDADGFTVGSNVEVNTNTENYVAWQWKANGSGSSNTDGSITSTVSVNQTAGFSIVTYTGNSSASTVGHGLGVAPAMIIVKKRSGAANDWAVWNKNLSAAQILLLNSTAAAYDPADNDFQDTAPTSSVFYITATNGRTNSSGEDFVAYCFAEVEGFSKFGGYTGNGSTNGSFVYCGFRPALVIIKRTSGTATKWVMLDSARDLYNPTDAFLHPNETTAENQGGDVDFLSNGFKTRANDSWFNGAGSTYVFAAFAEHPFGGDGVVTVPAR